MSPTSISVRHLPEVRNGSVKQGFLKLQVTVTSYKLLTETVSLQRLHVVAYGCRWLQVVAGGCKRPHRRRRPLPATSAMLVMTYYQRAELWES